METDSHRICFKLTTPIFLTRKNKLAASLKNFILGYISVLWLSVYFSHPLTTNRKFGFQVFMIYPVFHIREEICHLLL